MPIPAPFPTGVLNGLALGVGTPYRITGITGWHDMSQSPLGGAGALSSRQTSLGSWDIPYEMPVREITLQLTIEAASGVLFEAAVAGLKAVTQPGMGTVPLTLAPGSAAESLTATGTVISRMIPTTLDYLAGYTVAQLSIECTDPRLFSSPLTNSTALPSSTGGLTWPVTWPVQWNSVPVSGSIVLNNTGDAPGALTLSVVGPCIGPIITQLETGAILSLPSLTVNAGDTLVINCDPRAQSILLNGQASRINYATSLGFPSFIPGTNTYGFNAGTYNAGSLLTATATPAVI